MKDVKAIIWDYNGTLLNDLEIGVECINRMLQKRNLPLLTKESYQEVFTFPVKRYYEKVGFDFTREDWDAVANEFIAHYDALLPETTIFPEAHELLSIFNSQGKKQFILSAMEHNMLKESTQTENIQKYFTEISGINNFYASSKIENGKKLINSHQLRAADVCLLGDTAHDYEVAQELGCSCILIAAGHQSYLQLKETGCPVIVNNLQEIITD